MTMVIFGARGYLGSQFAAAYPDAALPPVDIADQASVRRVCDELQPEMIINCAGKTGTPNVDWCEDHKEETLRANVTGPLVLLHECLQRNISLVHMSSGCIYEGDNAGKGFGEDDPPNFAGSVYSRTKAWSDQMLREFPVLILRLRMPFDGTKAERNLLMKLRKYARVLDEPNSITYLPDFLIAARTLIEKRKTGIYNIVNPGVISPKELMEKYKEVVNPSHTFAPMPLADLGSVVRAGRSNCMLSGKKLAKEGIKLQPVAKAVEAAMRELAGK